VTVAVGLAIAIIVAAGGASIASNMGFKLNKQLFASSAAGGQVGFNWISLPYNNPYGDVRHLCDQLGLPGNATVQTKQYIVGGANDGSSQNAAVQVCGTCGATCGALVPGQGYVIHCPVATDPTPCPASVIIVGSHNGGTQITLPKTSSGIAGDWYMSVPYHTTAITLNDICVQAGMNGGLAKRLDASTGTTTSVTCPSPDAMTKNLVLGEHVQMRQSGFCSGGTAAPGTQCSLNNVATQCTGGGVCTFPNNQPFIAAHF